MSRFRLGCFLLPLVAAIAAAEPDPLLHLRRGHPRLLVTDAQLATAKQAAMTDPVQKALQTRIVELAESELSAKPLAHVLIGPRMLDQSRRAIESTRPPTAEENQNANTSMLATSLPSGGNGGRLAMLLTPGGPQWPKLPSPEISPLSSW